MFLVYAGILLAEDSAWRLGLHVVFLVIRCGLAAREERYPERKSGEDYRRYKTGAAPGLRV
jgi:protein-S-isoprenylcysteine O-methyltransferase Ste14